MQTVRDNVQVSLSVADFSSLNLRKLKRLFSDRESFFEVISIYSRINKYLDLQIKKCVIACAEITVNLLETRSYAKKMKVFKCKMKSKSKQSIT